MEKKPPVVAVLMGSRSDLPVVEGTNSGSPGSCRDAKESRS